MLILVEPTSGVDVGAKEEIFDVLSALAQDGTTLLLVSSDFEEVERLAGRALVFRKGEIVAELTSRNLSADRALEAAAA